MKGVRESSSCSSPWHNEKVEFLPELNFKMAENQPLLGGGGRQSGPPPRAAPAPYPPAQQAGAPPPSQPGAGGYQTTAGGPAGAGPAPSAAHAGDPMPGGNTTAPALESMEKVSGYEGTGFSEGRE